MARHLLENLEALSQNVPALTNAIDKLSQSLADQEDETKKLADQQESYNRALQETTVESQEDSSNGYCSMHLSKDCFRKISSQA